MMTTTSLHDLIKKYDVPVPRYTSYPTMPLWDTRNFKVDEWPLAVKRIFDETNRDKGISLYIHLPFCESLCTYCACHTRITKNHQVEERYIDALWQEWWHYLALFTKTPVIRELHLGGGTPTFFSAKNLDKLIQGILSKAIVHPDREFSFEGHPNNTTREHLEVLYQLGFRRVSYGVQDIDLKVQQAIHRVQPFENLEKVTAWSREIGYRSISFDLVYGLPHQNLDTVEQTIQKVIALQPDRVSYYSYAHVPWLKPGQRGYEDADLPTDVVKRSLYEKGRELFNDAGYYDVGMDHFALPGDTLLEALQQGTLHRNFMGYTTTATELLLGLGTSAISDAKYAYAQNVKGVEAYYELLEEGKIPVVKGHTQLRHDLQVKESILQVACQGKLSRDQMDQILTKSMQQELQVMQEEGLVVIDERGLQVTARGRTFIRNICRVFDVRMDQNKQAVTAKPMFSKAI